MNNRTVQQFIQIILIVYNRV